jgi:putative two-component system response regulator
MQAEDQSLKPIVLIVDDNPDDSTVVGDLLLPWYEVLVASSGEKALGILAQGPLPDLILLEIIMPVMDGYEVIGRLKDDPRTQSIPVIFLTAMDSRFDEEKGLDLGAVDYITKPIHAPILLARVRTHIELKKDKDILLNQNAYLEAEVEKRMRENEAIQDVSIRSLARLAEIRDDETGKHLLRTSLYVKTLAEILQKNPRFTSVLTDHVITLLAKSAPLHDIGKVGIPDRILMKPGKLTDEEWAIMKTHAWLGAQAIERAEQDAEVSLEFLVFAKEIAHWHHERWDGTGYPDGLGQDSIPISAKLMALADVFDALVSKRVYKEVFSYEQAREIIAAGRGNHFDPVLVDAFLANYERFVGIAEQHKDEASLMKA